MESVKLLKELMKIDSSILEKANEAIDYSAEYLKENGIEGKILENNGYKSYVAIIGKGEKTLVLNGHLDVVSGKPSQFEPVEKDGRIIGRGSADMKSGCVAMMQALIKLKDEPLKSKIMLQLVTDEEIGGYNCSRYLVEKGYIGNFVICTEPTNLKISIQSKGIIIFDVESSGVSSHGSRPWEGENAILKSIDNYLKIKKLPIMNIGSEFYENSTVNLAKIEGGDIYNRVPDKSVMGLDVRYVPTINPNEIVRDIIEIVDGKVDVKIMEPGVYVEPNNIFIKQLEKSIKKVLPNESIEFASQHGGSDARLFAEKGIPSIELGTKGNYWHGDKEYVEIESMIQLEEILIDFAKSF